MIRCLSKKQVGLLAEGNPIKIGTDIMRGSQAITDKCAKIVANPTYMKYYVTILEWDTFFWRLYVMEISQYKKMIRKKG